MIRIMVVSVVVNLQMIIDLQQQRDTYDDPEGQGVSKGETP